MYTLIIANESFKAVRRQDPRCAMQRMRIMSLGIVRGLGFRKLGIHLVSILIKFYSFVKHRQGYDEARVVVIV